MGPSHVTSHPLPGPAAANALSPCLRAVPLPLPLSSSLPPFPASVLLQEVWGPVVPKIWAKRRAAAAAAATTAAPALHALPYDAPTPSAAADATGITVGTGVIPVSVSESLVADAAAAPPLLSSGKQASEPDLALMNADARVSVRQAHPRVSFKLVLSALAHHLGLRGRRGFQSMCDQHCRLCNAMNECSEEDLVGFEGVPQLVCRSTC